MKPLAILTLIAVSVTLLALLLGAPGAIVGPAVLIEFALAFSLCIVALAQPKRPR